MNRHVIFVKNNFAHRANFEHRSRFGRVRMEWASCSSKDFQFFRTRFGLSYNCDYTVANMIFKPLPCGNFGRGAWDRFSALPSSCCLSNLFAWNACAFLAQTPSAETSARTNDQHILEQLLKRLTAGKLDSVKSCLEGREIRDANYQPRKSSRSGYMFTTNSSEKYRHFSGCLWRCANYSSESSKKVCRTDVENSDCEWYLMNVFDSAHRFASRLVLTPFEKSTFSDANWLECQDSVTGPAVDLHELTSESKLTDTGPTYLLVCSYSKLFFSMF